MELRLQIWLSYLQQHRMIGDGAIPRALSTGSGPTRGREWRSTSVRSLSIFSLTPHHLSRSWEGLERAFGITRAQQRAAPDNGDDDNAGLRLYIWPILNWSRLTTSMIHELPTREEEEKEEKEEEEGWWLFKVEAFQKCTIPRRNCFDLSAVRPSLFLFDV
ncbi:uncharacterized protein P884DRAFT_296348 [Thermothelomyces heterothallicus CBS 202.75]|uniref:uncharacterized protein n=1 Tax=Thermothelomyces heterothallicus CBS 202.75 TaxID=1149848 RepID=UPI00374266C1